ncbi:MAG: class I SAM-dependent methyltransferase [Deltaproteobacteria bacterium]|nr:class I SAM-dependent methyltransferase [Deltaproteobacteria bacterium]
MKFLRHEESQQFWGDIMAEEEPLREHRFPLVSVQTAITWRVLFPLLGPVGGGEENPPGTSAGENPRRNGGSGNGNGKSFRKIPPGKTHGTPSLERAAEIVAADIPPVGYRHPIRLDHNSPAQSGDAGFRPLNVLDAGAGTGRYSLPIARMGHQVTHLDISEAMLERARNQAEREGLKNITFRQGDVKNLDGIADQAFDMVLCMDAPISYCYPDHVKALQEVCRVARERVVLMVSSRLGVVPFMLDYDIDGTFVPPDRKNSSYPFPMARALLENGVEDFPEDVVKYLEETGQLVPPDYSFTPDELMGLMKSAGFETEVLGGPGALARSIKPKSLEYILDRKKTFGAFLDMSMCFDFQTHSLGLGGVNLLAVGRRA